MKKHITFATLTAVLFASLTTLNPAHAYECADGTIADSAAACPAAQHEPLPISDAIPISETMDNCLGGSSDEPTNCAAEGDTDADPSYPDGREPAVADDEEEEAETPLWPMYLSLGAIGVTLVLILLINLTGRKYNKK